MERGRWVTFDESLEQGDETYWTIQLAFVCIEGNDESVKLKLARVLRFISDTMKYLNDMSDSQRVRAKTPWLEPHNVKAAQKAGEDVTIVMMESGSKMVFKEFCYYLREDDELNYIPQRIEDTGLNYDLVKVETEDQRVPPPEDLLKNLGEPYQSWKVKAYAGGLIKILEYDFIEGKSWPSSTKGWTLVLKQIETVHSLGYVHGDLLPRNIVFSGETGYVIDFDLMRLENTPYVSGYNAALAPYRHVDAKAGEEMKKEHDVHALAHMTIQFFDSGSNDIEAAKKCSSLSELLSLVEKPDVKPKKADELNSDATGGPARIASTVPSKKPKFGS